MIQKDILAKLLATENVTVLHENVPTASFDVKNRVLRLPQWDDMQSYTYDHLVGHEVGHALYTPFEGWHDSVSDRGPAFKSFLNVIEDARIEKLVQRKYPGLRSSFVKSYTKMYNEGFFGDIDNFNQLNLIDRINVLFKCGEAFGVQFSADEQHWIDEIRKAESWDQVVDIATRMYDSEKAKAEDELDQMEDGLNPDEDGDQYEEETQSFGGASDDDDTDGEEQEMDMDGDMMPSDQQTDSESQVDRMIKSRTDEELRDNMESEYGNEENTPYWKVNVRVGTVDSTPFIMGYKEVLPAHMNDTVHEAATHLTCVNDPDRIATELYEKFLSNNKRTINYLVKEFEMKKSAAAYARASISKTGILDPVKMNNYHTSEDIFRKVTVVPDGKSHGMIMYLDWSGSMWQDLHNTVIQTLNLVHFCRQVNIPFRVYAFSDTAAMESYDSIREYTEQQVEGFAAPRKDFRLLEFFNNKMNKADFQLACKTLLFISSTDVLNYTKNPYRLGGTPLDATLLIASDIHDKFKKLTRVDIVNTIFLTDGDSHPTTYKLKEEDSYLQDIRGGATLIDTVTKKQYRTSRGGYGRNVTKQFIKMYKDRTGSNVIGFRIVSSSKSKFSWVVENASDENWKSLLKEKFLCVSEGGYNKLFILRSGKDLSVENNGLSDDLVGAKKGALTSAFKKAAKGKIVSRTLLNRFIDEVA